MSVARRGRPRTYDHVEFTIRVKVPVEDHLWPHEFDSAFEYLDSFMIDGDDKIGVQVNGRRCRFHAKAGAS